MRKQDGKCCAEVAKRMPGWEKECLADHCADGKPKCKEEVTKAWNAIMEGVRMNEGNRHGCPVRPAENTLIDPLIEEHDPGKTTTTTTDPTIP